MHGLSCELCTPSKGGDLLFVLQADIPISKRDRILAILPLKDILEIGQSAPDVFEKFFGKTDFGKSLLQDTQIQTFMISLKQVCRMCLGRRLCAR